MARVYISSSFMDLREERRAVADTITARGHLAVGMESYRATDTPAAEFCIADVKRSDIYIGIFAFRYGSGIGRDARSITEMEYEAASEANIRRFIFLLREDVPWPVDRIDPNRSAILGLRKRLAERHMVKIFSNAQELAGFVRDVIDFELPTAPRDIPPDLCYRCDRGAQEDSLAKVLERTRESDQPVGFIVHGDELQGHDRFYERLREVILPKYLSVDGREVQVKPYKLKWPAGAADAAQARRMLLRELGDRTLRRPNATENDIQAHLMQLPAPALIYAYCRGDDWEREGEHSARAFIDLWKGWELNPGQRLVVLLFIRYRRGERTLLEKVRFWRSGSRIETFLKGLSNGSGPSCFTVLPRLHDVTRQEAEDWAGEEEVAMYRSTGEVVAEIGRRYEQWRATKGTDAIPMEDLGPMLRDALERFEPGRDRAA